MKNFILITGLGLKLPINDGVVFPIEINGGAGAVDEFENGSKTTHSKDLEVEGSAVVMDFFRQFLDFGDGDINSTYLPTSRINASLFLNHEERLNGVLLLKGATKRGDFTTFKVQIFNESVDFLTLAENVRISSLPMNELNHTYNMTSIEDTWDLSKDYYYGLVDKGFDRVFQREISISSFGMYFKMKALLLRIFLHFNVQFTSNFITSNTDFANILIGYGGGEDLVAGSPTSDVEVEFGRTFSVVIADILEDYVTFPISSYSTDSALTVITDVDGQVSGSQINISYSGTAQYALNGLVTFTFSEPLDTDTGVNNNPLTVGVTVGSSNVFQVFQVHSRTSTTITYNVAMTGLLAGVNSGDVAFTTMTTGFNFFNFSPVNPTTLPTLSVTTDFNLTLENASVKLEEGTPINVPSYLPDMTCAEFFRGVVKTFGLEYEMRDGTMIIEPFEAFYKARDLALNKTSSMDRQQPIELEVIQNDQPKRINFKMAENKDFEALRYTEGLSRNYGDKIVTNESFFAVDSKDITLPFAPVISFKYSDNVLYDELIIPRLMKVKDGGTFEPQKGKPRICYPKLYPPTTLKRLDIVKTDLTLIPTYTYGTVQEFTPNFTLMFENPAVTFAPIAMPLDTLYTRFHSSKVDNFISQFARKFTAYFRLNDFDLKTFDRRLLWKIEGSYYRVVSIPDADPSSVAVSKVELIKMTRPAQGRAILGIVSPPIIFSPNPPSVGSSGGIYTELGVDYTESIYIYDGVLWIRGQNINDLLNINP